MVSPAVWGPPVWDAFHFIAAGYPLQPTDADARSYGEFMRLFAAVLPCAPCRQNFAQHMRDIPAEGPLAKGRVEFFAWSVAFHNAVNAALGKPAMSLEDAVNRYVDADSTPRQMHARYTTHAFAALVAVAIVAAAYFATRAKRTR